MVSLLTTNSRSGRKAYDTQDRTSQRDQRAFSTTRSTRAQLRLERIQRSAKDVIGRVSILHTRDWHQDGLVDQKMHGEDARAESAGRSCGSAEWRLRRAAS